MPVYVVYSIDLVRTFQVYAPCSSHSIHVYREFIDDLNAVFSMYCQNWLVGCFGFNGPLSISVYIGPSPKERETEK